MIVDFNSTYACKKVSEKDIVQYFEILFKRKIDMEGIFWDVVCKPAREVRVGNKLTFIDKDDNDLFSVTVVDSTTASGRTIQFNNDHTLEEYNELLKIVLKKEFD